MTATKTYYGLSSNTNHAYYNDWKFGTEQERLMYPLLKTVYGEDLVWNNADKTAKFDYQNGVYNVEMKSRKYKSYQFDELEISADKCIIMDGKKTILIMNMIDKLLAIEYTPESFQNFRQVHKSRDNIKGNEKLHYYIPTNLFRVLSTNHRPDENGCLIKFSDF